MLCCPVISIVSIDKIDFSAKLLQVRFKTKAWTASCYAARALQWHLRSITSQGSSPRTPGPQGSFISCLFSPEPVSKMKAELLEWNCVWAFLELSCFLTLGTREDWVLHCVGVRSPFPGPRIMPRNHEGQSLSRRNFWLLLTSSSVITVFLFKLFPSDIFKGQGISWQIIFAVQRHSVPADLAVLPCFASDFGSAIWHSHLCLWSMIPYGP